MQDEASPPTEGFEDGLMNIFFFNRWIDRGDSFGLGPFEITLNKKCISLKLILLKGYGIELNIFAMD